MNGNCSLENIVFQAKIFPKEGNFNDKIYMEISSLKWMFIWYNYKHSFTNP